MKISDIVKNFKNNYPGLTLLHITQGALVTMPGFEILMKFKPKKDYMGESLNLGDLVTYPSNCTVDIGLGLYMGATECGHRVLPFCAGRNPNEALISNTTVSPARVLKIKASGLL